MADQPVARLVGYIEARGVGEYVAGLKAAGRATSDTGQKVDKGMRRFGSAFENAGAKISSVGRSMSGMSIAAGAGVGYAVKKFGEFDQVMRQVGAVSGATGSQLGALNDLALKMGAQTSYSAKEAADAMLELAKGGMTQAQIKAGALKATLTLAAAGGLELGSAATYMTNTLNAFGLGAGDANRVAAALAGGANASTASVESLGQGLAQVSSGARNAGLSLNETVGVLALFDQAGVKGSDAGTSLKTMLAALTPNSKEAAAAMQSLGLSFVDARGKFLPIASIADQLKSKLGKMSAAQRSAALETIFGSDAARAASILMRSGAKGVEKFTKATRDLGAAQRLAKANTSGQAGAIERMKGSIETAAIAIGAGLAPTITFVAGVVEKMANAFGKLSPKTQKIIGVMLLLAAAFAPVLIAVGAMVSSVGVLAGALGAVEAPVLLVVGAVIALGVAFAILYKKSATVRAAVSVLWSLFKITPLGLLLKAINNVAKSMGGWKGVFLNAKLEFLKLAANALKAFQLVAIAGSQLPGKVGESFRTMAKGISRDLLAVDVAITNTMTDIDGLSTAAGRTDKAFRAAMARSISSARTFEESIKRAKRTYEAWNPRPKRARLTFEVSRGNLRGFAPGTLGVPAMASGGVVTRPTMALVGEAGPEAVIPLNKLERMIGGKGGGRTVEHHWHVANPVEDIPALMSRIDWYSRTRGWS